MTDEVVTRLYRALVEELQRRGHPADRPVKVSELYQDLVPYRAVRGAIGVELNADYEHALLRLLAGERDLLRLEPAPARDELRQEVEAPYPFVGLFRKYSGSKVWVNKPQPDGAEEADEEVGQGPVEEPAAPEPSEAQPSGVPTSGQVSGPRPVTTQGGVAAERAPIQLHTEPAPAGPEHMTHAGQACPFCSETLPDGRRVRFCPFCGGDQRLQPCPRCEAVLERGWRYCISCGHEMVRG